MNVPAIPSAREVYFLISTNKEFVEKTLLEMYRRHQANKGISNGKGFNHQTIKDGVRLGRWLDKHGQFTTSFTPGRGENRSRKTADDHVEAARQVLYKHVDQIIKMITEKVEAKLQAKKEAARIAAERNAKRQANEAAERSAQLALNGQRSAEILSMLDEISEDERPTERTLTPLPWRRTA